MSLLNDALRKQNRRLPATQGPAAAAVRRFAALRPPLSRRRWAAASLGFVLAVMGITGVIWTLRPAATDLSAPQFSAVRDSRPELTAPVTTAASSEGPVTISAPADAPTPIAATAAPAQAAIAAAPSPAAPAPVQSAPASTVRPVPASRPTAAPPSAAVARPHTADPPRQQPASASPAAPSVEQLYRQARLYHRKQRYDAAIAGYRAVLQQAPDHFGARADLAAAYIEVGDFEQARVIAAALHRQDETHPQVMINLAIALIGSGRPAEAVDLLEPATRRPGAPSFDVWLHLGIAHRKLHQLDEALACYRQAEALAPDAPPLLFNLALVQDGREDYLAAIHYYQRYLAGAATLDNAAKRPIEQRVQTLRAFVASQARPENRP
jgi:Flp pilus assembly protein TadD